MGPKHGWSNPNFFLHIAILLTTNKKLETFKPRRPQLHQNHNFKGKIWSNSICKVERTPYCFSMHEITMELKWEVSIDSSRAPDFNSKWLPVFFKRGNYGQSNEANKYGKTRLSTESPIALVVNKSPCDSTVNVCLFPAETSALKPVLSQIPYCRLSLWQISKVHGFLGGRNILTLKHCYSYLMNIVETWLTIINDLMHVMNI